MAIRDLLVAYNASKASEKALSFAISLAQQHDACLTGVHVRASESYDSHVRRWMSKEVIDVLKSAEAAADTKIAESFAERIAAAGLTARSTWVVEEGFPNRVLASFSRYYDLLVIGQFSEGSANTRMTVNPEEILSRSGRPLILVPRSYAPTEPGTYAVAAWDASRAASRALSEAVQILEGLERLDILTVGDAAVAPREGRDIALHVRRHGIEATTVARESSVGQEGAQILSYCKETEPGILIMGIRSSAPLRNALFGSVSDYLLAQTHLPLFMAA